MGLIRNLLVKAVNTFTGSEYLLVDDGIKNYKLDMAGIRQILNEQILNSEPLKNLINVDNVRKNRFGKATLSYSLAQNQYTAVFDPAPDTFTDASGSFAVFTVSTVNDAADPTISVTLASLSTVVIPITDASGNSVPAGALTPGVHIAVYDGTNYRVNLGSVSYFTSTLPDNTTVTNPVGQINSSVTVAQLKVQTLSQIIEQMLFNIIQASATNPTATLTYSNVSSPREVGEQFNVDLAVSFNRGQITNGNGSPGPELVGAATSFVFSGLGITGTQDQGLVPSLSLVGISSLVEQSVQWTAQVNHGVGTGDYFDNIGGVGTNLDGSRVAGSVTDNSPILRFWFPYYYNTAADLSGVVDDASAQALIGDVSTVKVIGSSDGSITLSYASGQTHWWFAHPVNNRIAKTEYFTALNTWSSNLAAVFNIITDYTVNINGVPAVYKFYINTTPSTSNPLTIR